MARQNTNVKDSPITKNTQINDVVGHLLEMQGIDPREILTSLSAIKPAVKTKETIEFTFPKNEGTDVTTERTTQVGASGMQNDEKQEKNEEQLKETNKINETSKPTEEDLKNQ